jgi:hypothetical protein
MSADADPLRADGNDFVAPYGGPIWLSRIALQTSERVRLAFEVEVGFTTLPARAEIQGEGVALALDDVSITSLVSVGFAF